MSDMSVIDTVEVKKIMDLKAAKTQDKEQSLSSEYYSVYLKNLITDEYIRVRTPVFYLDGERRPVIRNNEKVVRNPHDVGLDVWATYGADDHDLELVMRGPLVAATPSSIANDLAMKKLAESA